MTITEMLKKSDQITPAIDPYIEQGKKGFSVLKDFIAKLVKRKLAPILPDTTPTNMPPEAEKQSACMKLATLREKIAQMQPPKKLPLLL